MIDPLFYDSQATLDSSRPCYVERQADRDLLATVLEGTYPLLLSSRKMGKSSLIERVLVTLREQPVPFLVTKKELTLLGSADNPPTADQWCYGIARDLVAVARMRCGFIVDPAWKDWWRAEDRLAAIERFFAFIREFLLNRSEARWAIAIDEIETTILLPFSDDFFAGLRSCVTGRAGDPALHRLTFILAGVTTPSRLITDASRTPFNVGRVISIRDFSPLEAAHLLPGLGVEPDEESPPLLAVLHWTDGHPYLTQRLFKDLATALQERGVEDASEVTDWPGEVSRLVERRYLRPGVRVTEEHFADITQRRLAKCKRQRTATGFLRRYRLALRGKSLPDEPLSLAMTQLKLSGLVKPAEDGSLIIHNLLYRRVFDQRWVADEMPANGWKRAAIAVGAVLPLAVLLTAMLWLFWLSPRAVMEAEIFTAVRSIAFAQEGIPTSEHQQLEGYSDEQIARSIRKGKGRIADVKLSPDQHATLLKYVDEPHISEKLWDDYWGRQAEALERLAARLATTSKSIRELDGTMADFKATAARLQQGLLQGEGIASRIHGVSGKAMTRTVKGLWETVDLGVPGKPSKAEIKRALTAASGLTAKWEVLAEVAGGLAPLVDDEALKEGFALLVNGPRNRRQNIMRADATARQRLAELLKQAPGPESRPSGGSIRLDSMRMRAHRRALDGIVRNSGAPVAQALGFTICDAMASPQETDSSRLSAFGSALDLLVSRRAAWDAAPLAERLAKVLAGPQETDSRRLWELAGALDSLATRLDAKGAAPLAARLAKAMESPQETDSRRLSSLGRALDSLAARLDARDAVLLAARLAEAMESPEEMDSGRLLALGHVLGSLAAPLATKDAAPLAARGAVVLVKALENPQEENPDSLSSLADTLAALAARMDPDAAAPLAARGAVVLAEALENSQEEDADSLSALGSALGSLAARLDPKDAAPLAARGAVVLVKALENPQEEDADSLTSLTEALAAIAGLMDPNAAAPLAARGAAVLVRALENSQEEDADDLASLAEALAAMARLMDSNAAATLAPRGAVLLVKALENLQEEDVESLSALGRALGLLAAWLDPDDAAPLAARGATVLARALENSQEEDADDLMVLAHALAATARVMNPDAAAVVAARGIAVLAKAMGSLGEDDNDEGMWLGLGLSPLLDLTPPQQAAAAARKWAGKLTQIIESGDAGDLDDMASIVLVVSMLSRSTEPAQAQAIASRNVAALTAALRKAPADRSTNPLILGVMLASLAAQLPPDEGASGMLAASALLVDGLAAATRSNGALFSELKDDWAGFEQAVGPSQAGVLVRSWASAVETLMARQPAQQESFAKILKALRELPTIRESKTP